MANEFLQRTPTSVGNQRVWTWSGWVKRNIIGGQQNLWRIETGASNDSGFRFDANNSTQLDCLRFYLNGGTGGDIVESAKRRDLGTWMNVMVIYDSTASTSSSRVQLYVNGIRVRNFSTESYPTLNYLASFNGQTSHKIGASTVYGEYSQQQFTDIFFIDGQALTPDVFGFNKPGKGYISAGSTISTDFRGGQWVPKTPRIIKAEINRRGGFGVNGFYLPMNDSNNFGADFHGTPNSIIKLQENLPQPRCRIDGVGDYTGALRDDPFKQYLVLAIPFVSGGLQSGLGDYSAAIRGSGIPKTVTSSNVSISTVPSYYGSASNFTSSSSSYITTPRNVSDYNMGSGDYTVEGWFYFKSINTGQYTRFFSIGNGSLEGIIFELVISTSVLSFYSRDTGSNDNRIDGPVIVAGQWYHIALCRKSSTISAYINGVCVGTANISTRTINFDSNTAVVIGAWENSVGSYTRFADAYMQDIRVYKGIAKYTGGFDVPRPYTPVGIATWRAVPDTTANNFCTLNPLDKRSTGLSLSSGNLYLSGGSLNEWSTIKANIGVSTGKWYWEISNIYRLGPGSSSFGAVEQSHRVEGDIYIGKSGFGVGYSYGDGALLTTTDVIGITLDMTNGILTWYKNGVQVQTQNGITGSWMPAISHAQTNPYCVVNFGQNPTFSGNTTAGTFTDSNGKGLFRYQPPTGFLALCEDNLPKPTVEDPGKHFKTILYTGNGLNGRSISGVGFKPDLVWAKQRDESRYHSIYDSVRGSNLLLRSDNVAGDVDAAGTGLNSFDSDGFSVGIDNGINKANQQYVAWCWKAGNTTQTNTSGSITSTVSVNQTAGFSIVSWTGNGSTSTQTIGHGLNRTPSFTIVKARDNAVTDSSANDWWVYFGQTDNLRIRLNRIDSAFIDGNNGLRHATNSGRFTLASDSTIFRESNVRYIAYTWAEIEGFSKFGSYVGNGSSDGPFVYCGFKPAWILIKQTNTTGDWNIWDSSRVSTNPNQLVLSPNVTNLELSWGGGIDFLSNGFKLRSTEYNFSNINGGTFIFAAFAESPFQTANAK